MRKLPGDFASVTALHDCPACRRARIEKYTPADPSKGEEVIRLYRDASSLLDRWSGEDRCASAIVKLCEAHAEGDDIVMDGIRIPTLRSQALGAGEPSRGLSDYPAESSDYAGAFAVSIDFADEVRAADEAADSYRSLRCRARPTVRPKLPRSGFTQKCAANCGAMLLPKIFR